jgi:hypothetical protein
MRGPLLPTSGATATLLHVKTLAGDEQCPSKVTPRPLEPGEVVGFGLARGTVGPTRPTLARQVFLGAPMISLYDAIAENCAALAKKTKRESHRVRLLQLADQWRGVSTDGQGPGKKPAVPARLAGDIAHPVGLLARQIPNSPESGPKSSSDEIKSHPKLTKEAALDRARDAIGVLSRDYAGGMSLMRRLWQQRRDSHSNSVSRRVASRTSRAPQPT